LSSRKKLIAKLDKRWSKAVVDRDKGICQKCYAPGDNPHHVFLRRYLGSRFLLKNGITLCTKCHRWAHDNPIEFMEWWQGKYGFEKWEYLRMKAMELKVNIEGVEI
jgi:5-methylcytosine-specific restriction endonuclease McrA